MTPSTLKSDLELAIPKLFEIAQELTWNKLSENCKFILTEIKERGENFHVQRRIRKKENDNLTPMTIDELLPKLLSLYDKFYDINLQIYRASKSLTIIEISYYSKSSLDIDYQQKIMNTEPMLHCKVSMPPWLSDKKEKFDINWEHYEMLTKWNLSLYRFKLKIKID